MRTEDTYLDEVAVERRMAGEKTIPLTKREQAEVVRRLIARGIPKNEVERRTGLNPYRVLAVAA